jgi:4'-phosphopantetheinyl transferase
MARAGMDVYVWMLDQIGTAQAFELCFAVLSLDEQHRVKRLVQERHKRQYIFAHGLLRFALSNFAPHVEPSGWSFVRGRCGRPLVSGPAGAPTIYFSLSHTDGCVACILSDCESVGVDVEKIEARDGLLEAACSAFSCDEIRALRGLPRGVFVERFFDYWTLKEAYIKAKGCGLNLLLDQFSLQISSDEITLKLPSDVGDERWHFTMSSPSKTHRLPTAAEFPGACPLSHGLGRRSLQIEGAASHPTRSMSPRPRHKASIRSSDSSTIR